MLEMNRRSLITGLVSLVAAPAIVRAGSLMPVKQYDFAPSELMFDKVNFVDVEGVLMKTFRLVMLPTAETKGRIIQLVEDESAWPT